MLQIQFKTQTEETHGLPWVVGESTVGWALGEPLLLLVLMFGLREDSPNQDLAHGGAVGDTGWVLFSACH